MTLTTSMLTQIRSDVKDDIEAIFGYSAIGESSTTPTAADTKLNLEVLRKAVTSWDESQADRVTASLQIGTTEANGNTVRETGWISAAAFSVDACDATTDWTDSADMTISLNSSTYKENSKALNLTKDGTSSVNASTSKTTTSRDFTSKNLSLWLYILDSTTLNLLATTDCITIRFGSDSSNYYQWTKDKADLSTGWNLIQALTSSNADSTTGSPSLTAMDYTFIQVTTAAAGSTWSAGAVIMDHIVLTSGTLYTRNTMTAITKTSDIQLYMDTQVIITVTET